MNPKEKQQKEVVKELSKFGKDYYLIALMQEIQLKLLIILSGEKENKP